jgi:hypothetical protein
MDVSKHLVAGVVEKDTENPGKYKFVCCCPECGEFTGEEYPITDTRNLAIGAASLFSSGSVITICSLSAIAIAAAIVIYLQRKKKMKEEGEHEEA